MTVLKGRFRRILGRYAAGRPGPTLVVCGGLHGNEPAGVRAAERVLAYLERERPPVRGEVFALAGNLAALEQGRRFVARDLNRCWLESAIAALKEREPGDDGPEEKELRALVAHLDEAVRRARGPVTVLDLHTTSADSAPFVLMSDTLSNRRVAFALPGPVILGLEESVDGTLLEYITELGHRAFVVEAGRHDDPAAVVLHEATIWLTLHSAGCLAEVPDLDGWRLRYREACRGLPRIVEVRHHYRIEPQDGFRMRPGYRGFQPVRAGEVLASDLRGEIKAPDDGLLLMPLYQEQGEEGFFIVRKVSRFWLWLSAVVRRLKLHGLVALLPGVSRHPDRPRTLRVNPHVARWFVVQVFHLFGYRRRRSEGEYLVFSRRRPM